MNNHAIPETKLNLAQGFHEPQGATPTADGVNFAVYSQYASQVYLLLFDQPHQKPTEIIELTNKTGYVWHVFVYGLKPGQLYAFKVDGKYDPKNGYRFNKNKCLLDPYAKAITGKFVDKQNLLFAYNTKAKAKDLSFDSRDNTTITPKALVIDKAFDWQETHAPDIPLHELIIYEVHVKGFTAHPSSKVQFPGTYLGFVEKISYLQKLGINAVELLPVQESFTNGFLAQRNLKNYWGYDTIGFFMPESSYSTQSHPGCQVNEFKILVRELHRAGIEVILDVVYNHSGESDEFGPTICFRGIDNQTYYALQGTADEPYRHYRNNAGTGNMLNIENPQALKMVIDSLKYWIKEMHVDGFRFDLATVLGLQQTVFNNNNNFFKAIEADPIFNKIKLIAEPWDLTTYRLGQFPTPWAEWNDKFRDTMRRFWRGDKNQIKDLAWRLCGSQDIFGNGRTPNHSINFITCHDGFTLLDLYSYQKKHNLANGEHNLDGAQNNLSWNCGIEGDSTDPHLIKLRRQMIKNAFCCLLFSLGTPLINGGDELLRTQKGNNNAYCQDNKLSWFDWEKLIKNQDIFLFVQRAIAFRKTYPLFQKTTFFSGKDWDNNAVPDIDWFDTNLKKPKWDNPEIKLICYLMDVGEVSSKWGNYFLFFILNAYDDIYPVKIPSVNDLDWHRVIDTSLPAGEDFLPFGEELLLEERTTYRARPFSFVALLGKEQQRSASYYLG